MKSVEQDTVGMNLQENLTRLRGFTVRDPETSIIIPVNAQGDLENLQVLLYDLARYQGNHTFEVIAVINNYQPDNPPVEIELLRKIGLSVIDIPNVRRSEESVALSARVAGLLAAASEITIHFDADCRIPNPSALLDYYVDQLHAGFALAYTSVHFFDLPSEITIRFRVRIHHTVRAIKRNLLNIPTPRGSNYAINRKLFLQLYETGKLKEDIQIGRNVKVLGGRIIYSNAWDMRVLTSGRKFQKGWLRICRYVLRRFMFNLLFLRDTSAGRSVNKASENETNEQYISLWF